jgi:hypothetical protein
VELAGAGMRGSREDYARQAQRTESVSFVNAEEKLTAFLELEINTQRFLHALRWITLCD